MAKQSRRQHTVSKFYLRGFADETGLLRRIELPGDSSVPISVGDATVINDFYSIDLPDGTATDYYERMFSGIETAAAPAFSAIGSGSWPLGGELREALSAWVALQHVRGTREREFIAHHSSKLIRLIVGISGKEALRRHIEAALGRGVGDAELALEWNDLTKQGGPTMEPDKVAHMRLVTDLVPGTAAYLADCHWTLVRFERKSLVTSDHPAAMSVDVDYPEYMGVGIATADLYSVPLARRVALTIQPRRRLERYWREPESVPDFHVSGSTSQANSFNQNAIAAASRYVFTHPEERIDSRIVFPNRERFPHSDDHDAFVFEDGLPAGAGALSPLPTDHESRDSFSLTDLPWPIPGRVSPSA